MQKELPDFGSEAEEADWWFAHRDEVSDYMANDAAEGKLINLQDFLLAHGLCEEIEPVTLPLRREDVVTAKEKATSVGMSYEDYLSTLVHEALKSSQAA